MKSIFNRINGWLSVGVFLAVFQFLATGSASAQQDSAAASQKVVKPKPKPVKNTFQSVWIIDNQTVMVPVKGTFEMDIMHRFGVITNGYKDFYGVFAPSNIRLGVDYAPISNLYVGVGLTKSNMILDGSLKYSIIKQTPGRYPVSVTYYGDMGYDTREDPTKSIFTYQSQRFVFFNQIIIARKISNKLSIQVAPSISHQNSVPGFYTKYDTSGVTKFKNMHFDHFAIAFDLRYKLTNVTSLLLNYDQPLTRHPVDNPNPNLSAGFEFNTSNHSFQLFVTNYYFLNPARNNLYNTNNPIKHTDPIVGKQPGGQFLIGFNITRLWNY